MEKITRWSRGGVREEHMLCGDTIICKPLLNKGSVILLTRPREMEIHPQKTQTITPRKTLHGTESWK